MDRRNRIFIAGHRGLVGSAMIRRLDAEGYQCLPTATRASIDGTLRRSHMNCSATAA